MYLKISSYVFFINMHLKDYGLCFLRQVEVFVKLALSDEFSI